MNDSEKAAACFIAGYVRQTWVKTNEKPDPMVIGALRTLKVPKAFLPEIEPPKYPPVAEILERQGTQQ